MSWKLTLDEVLKATGGKTLSEKQTEWSGIGTDSRLDLTGQLFIALRGDQFDAHDFVESAVTQGATGLLVDKFVPELKDLVDQVTLVQVRDTLKGLQDLGSYWRRKNKAKIIAITGSTGKTTTKEFVASLLNRQFKTHYNKGSYNNHWGVPLTLLAIEPEHEVAVVEMGMNHSGEITRLCEIASPDIVLVTNVGQAHIGELGSLEAVVQAKWELYRSCPKAIQVYNLVNEHTIRMHEEAVKKGIKHILTFSAYKSNAEVNLRVTEIGLDFIQVMGLIGEVEGDVRVPVFGRQNGTNIMAAAALAMAAGMGPEQIWAGLPELRCAWGRNQLVRLKCGTPVLFDGYNANPESMAALIKNLYEMPMKGKKILVLGEMLELGKESDRLHEELGEMVGNIDVDTLWFIGPSHAAFERGVRRTEFRKNLFISDTYKEELATRIGSMLNDQDIVAIKGSRGMKLEQVIKAWDPIGF
ncbi:MAG: UDP-N-acetylmuramoyl-tripeptide--D-alanyl-D-alanine ligase [Bdellovibrionaceae bacterium]|nr:UDP-N-acetylmuramoyl-tripeptide--D-alanyl-D-alanine ligase [Bdellovibrionales bacterium]MCB9084787.1 UDP-N-acetylmuramoyl-tripeptide--D-alanyl-D-alanine ligase [Pseudobdellovibrionaceae bacterium]